MSKPKRKITDYIFNALLVIIVLILIVPSWRISFQGWFQGLFMSEVEFKSELSESIPEKERNWALFDTENKLYNFDEFKGKPIVLSFWATWCPPCRAELPELQELKNEMKGSIHVIAVSEESMEVIQNSELPLDYDFLFNTPQIPAYYKVDSYPTLLVIDKKMNIVFRNKGAGSLNTEENKSFLKNLIRES
ncbi:MAG: TlpA family protein disulfide reductase [Crocinitomicaceae bacterium]|nr:TlpA family protein disulfide reductase [Crocinitomicaceae bacterium]